MSATPAVFSQYIDVHDSTGVMSVGVRGEGRGRTGQGNAGEHGHQRDELVKVQQDGRERRDPCVHRQAQHELGQHSDARVSAFFTCGQGAVVSSARSRHLRLGGLERRLALAREDREQEHARGIHHRQPMEQLRELEQRHVEQRRTRSCTRLGG